MDSVVEENPRLRPIRVVLLGFLLLPATSPNRAHTVTTLLENFSIPGRFSRSFHPISSHYMLDRADNVVHRQRLICMLLLVRKHKCDRCKFF